MPSFLDHFKVTSPLTSFQFGAMGVGDRAAAIDGDLDHRLLLFTKFIPGDEATTYILRAYPGTVYTVADWRSALQFGTGAGGVSDLNIVSGDNPRIGSNVAGVAGNYGGCSRLIMDVRDDGNDDRAFKCQMFAHSQGAIRNAFEGGGWGGSGKVTALTVESAFTDVPIPGGIGVGSEFWLYKWPLYPLPGELTIDDTGLWELVDYHRIVGASGTGFSFGASGAGTQLHPIDGDTEKVYKVISRIRRGIAAMSVTMDFGSVLTAGAGLFDRTLDSGINYSSVATGTFHIRPDASGTRNVGGIEVATSYLFCESGTPRVGMSQFGGMDTSGQANALDGLTGISGSLLNDTSANIDEIRLVWSTDGVSAGSDFSLYKLIQR